MAKMNLSFKMTTSEKLLSLGTVSNPPLTLLCVLTALSRAMQSTSRSKFDLEFRNHSFGNEVHNV